MPIGMADRPDRANRPEVPKGNCFIDHPQGKKSVLPKKDTLKLVVVDMSRNGDWVNLVIDVEDEKGNVVGGVVVLRQEKS